MAGNSTTLTQPIILGDISLASPTTSLTNGTAGAASALPSLPTGYVIFNIGNTPFQFPYYGIGSSTSSGTWLPLGGGTMTGNIAMGSHKLTGLSAGSTNGDSLRYEQVVGVYLPLAGGTLGGALAMGGNKITGLAAGTTSGDALRFEQVSGVYLPLAGGTLAGSLAMGTHSITGLAAGSTSAPSIAYASNTTTGIVFDIAATSMSLVVNGVENFRCNTTPQVFGVKGSESNPGNSSLNDGGTGWDCLTIDHFNVMAGATKVIDCFKISKLDGHNEGPFTIFGGAGSVSVHHQIWTSTTVGSVASQISELDQDGCLMVVTGHDVGSSNGFEDLLLTNYTSPNPTVVSSRTMYGGPGARTYSNGGAGVLTLSIASGTWSTVAFSMQISPR